MNPDNNSSARRFGHIDFIATLIAVLLLGLVAVFLVNKPARRNVHYYICVNNLKHVGYALKLFAGDHDHKYPWQISTNEGGVKEWVGTRQTFRLYLSLSNELSNPSILLCPKDVERERRTTFANLNNLNLSYFIGLDARERDPIAPTFGDRNLSVSGYQLSNGSYYISTQKVVTWASNIHVNEGNIALSDGSAHQMNNQKLQNTFNGLGRSTNFIAIP